MNANPPTIGDKIQDYEKRIAELTAANQELRYRLNKITNEAIPELHDCLDKIKWAVESVKVKFGL